MTLFSNPRLLLARARKHITEFKAVADAFSNSHPYTMFTEIDWRTGETLFKARIKEPIPEELGAIAFDIVGNLRSALDHAVYDCVRAITGVDAPQNTKFPFGSTKEKAAENIGGKKAVIPPDMQSFFIERFKPYETGDRLLYALNEVRNQKIHRTLSPMAVAHTGIGFKQGYIGNLHIKHTEPKWDAAKKELTYMTAGVVQNFHMEVKIAVHVVMNEPAFFREENAIKIFENFAQLVAAIIEAIETKVRSVIDDKDC